MSKVSRRGLFGVFVGGAIAAPSVAKAISETKMIPGPISSAKDAFGFEALLKKSIVDTYSPSISCTMSFSTSKIGEIAWSDEDDNWDGD